MLVNTEKGGVSLTDPFEDLFSHLKTPDAIKKKDQNGYHETHQSVEFQSKRAFFVQLLVILEMLLTNEEPNWHPPAGKSQESQNCQQDHSFPPKILIGKRFFLMELYQMNTHRQNWHRFRLEDK